MEPARYDMTRYLAAKRSVDDRALNGGVLAAFRDRLRPIARRPLRVLELGAGLGTMPVRLWQLDLIRDAHYTLVDRDGASLRQAERQLAAWAEGIGGVQAGPARLGMRCGAGALEVSFENAELFGYLRECSPRSFDVVLAHAVLDLVDVSSLLPLLWRAVAPGGLALLTINFDGQTIFVPELALDAEVLRLYHRSMDTRIVDGRAAGHSQTGRRLLAQLPESGASVLEAGGSTWLVRPTASRYPGDEAYFLHHIVDTIDCELRGHARLDASGFAEWVRARHAQIETGELVYIAHHLDVLASAPA
jgi:SAM-dependent methyltransferase